MTRYIQYLLGGAYGAGAHSDAESINSCANEVVGLPSSDHIASDDLDGWMLFLYVLDDVNLVAGIALFNPSQ